MKNRAKCKLCNSIIESFHSYDYVICKCGEISVDGGDAMRCAAKSWSNFVRVDDEGNDIIPIVKDDNTPQEELTAKDKLNMLGELIKSYERLPQHALLSPVTNADLCSALMLLHSILSDDLS